jgi:hypothetical protein
MLQVCHELSSWYICMTQGLVSHALGVPGLLSTITLVQVTHPRAFWHILQVYHQLLPWSNLHIPGPFVTCSRCTRSIINYHPGTCIHVPGPSVTFSRHTRSIINYHPGTCCISLGLLSHAPGVPGLSSIITLVQFAHPMAFCHMYQVYQAFSQHAHRSILYFSLFPSSGLTCIRSIMNAIVV